MAKIGHFSPGPLSQQPFTNHEHGYKTVVFSSILKNFWKGSSEGGRPVGIRFVRQSVRQHFGSYTITWVVLKVQLSYFIHRCRMAREDTYTFWSPKVKVTTELRQHFGSDTITWVVFNVQFSYFIHRCRTARGRYLYILGRKGQRPRSQRNIVNSLGSDTITWVVFNV